MIITIAKEIDSNKYGLLYWGENKQEEEAEKRPKRISNNYFC